MVSLDLSELDAINLINSLEITEEKKYEIYSSIADIIRQDIEKRFQTAPPAQTGGYVYPGNVQWVECSVGYLDSRPDRREGQLLIDTGKLKDSLTISDFPESLFRVDGLGFKFGTEVEYAGKQNDKRPFLFYHYELEKEIMETILDAV